MKVIGLLLPITVLPLAGFTCAHLFRGIIYPDGTKVPQSSTPITAAQRQRLQDGINGIGFPYAEFIRVHELGNFPESEIAYSTDEAMKNQQTQEIIVPYGIFLRTTPQQEKAEQLSDPNWVKHQHLYQSDLRIIKAALAKHSAETKSSAN